MSYELPSMLRLIKKQLFSDNSRILSSGFISDITFEHCNIKAAHKVAHELAIYSLLIMSMVYGTMIPQVIYFYY
jgi:hypothetical protein